MRNLVILWISGSLAEFQKNYYLFFKVIFSRFMNISSHFSAFLVNLYKILPPFGLCHLKKVKNWFKISEKQIALQNFELHAELYSPILRDVAKGGCGGCLAPPPTFITSRHFVGISHLPAVRRHFSIFST